ncbi:hypothetical protein GZ77_10680 [Endozoicomonas montiporae]|uniref:Lipid A biosynthesis acyltransferase n=2 Tax=Endozoicomonas montiporae TaxID=1027273 RepID=A0A081N8H9_9GAMM|nr:hypothetical protein [Endozoicomonas montiporae]AMO55350.1 lipid A biosynthesis lauroyl/myristoyl acyltransferase [Endozoicomonas montiporae CL-33]KEQ14752.1 hypothetical protein GZ77_10680 [Endozoicomonas montiporae]
MFTSWKEVTAERTITALSYLPDAFWGGFCQFGARLLDRSKGHIARAAIQRALPDINPCRRDQIARAAAWHSVNYALALPRLKHIPYRLHNLATVQEANAENRGIIIISLHTGAPDLGTMALTQAGIDTKTVIGAGKQSPWLNRFGRFALQRAGVQFIQRGNPTAVLQAVKKKTAVFLYSDMRSKEMPVTFFGQETSAPASGIYTALLNKSPILFHYCTLSDDGEWQLWFERYEPVHKDTRNDSVQYNLQQLIHKMEAVIRDNPELWIWHYDRFKLKKEVQK